MIIGKETPEKSHKLCQKKNRLIEKLFVEQLIEPVHLNVILVLWSRRGTNWVSNYLRVFREPAPS